MLKNLKTGPRDLARFGLVVGGVLALLAAWFWWRQKPGALYLLVPAVVLMLLGASWPKSLKHVYVAWMTLGFVLGLIVSTILLTLFFYLVLTPVGLLARLAGNDFMSRRLDKGAGTYWIRRTQPAAKRPQDYERQF